MHGHSKTSVKEQIQLTKGFIAAEKENHRSILAGSILHLHNESQLGENSLARGIHAITHNHGKSRPQTHIRQQRMHITRLGTRLCHGEGDNVNNKNLNSYIATCW